MTLTSVQKTALTEEIQKFIESNRITFKGGRKDSFINDALRSLQPLPDGKSWRTPQGQKVEVGLYLGMMVESGLYTTVKNFQSQYEPIFAIRSATVKESHTRFTQSLLQRALNAEGFVFIKGTADKIIKAIADRFLAVDGETGLEFVPVHDSPVGSFAAQKGLGLEELINTTFAARYIDADATKITRLSHRASLRATAVSMLEVGAKPKDIEKLTDELQAFEKRSLKANRTAPSYRREAVEQELMRRAELQGMDRMAQLATTRHELSRIDDITDVQGVIQKIEVPKEAVEYSFNENN
jgi:hypothetical protein